MPELDERHERRQAAGCPLELGERLARLREARVVLEQDAAELARQLERLERGAKRAKGVVGRLASCQVIAAFALTWKTNPSGVRSAQRPVTSGSGRA